MKRQLCFVIPVFLLMLAMASTAQQTGLELPDYTLEQRWQRSARQSNVNFALMISYAKSKGDTVDTFGRYLGKIYAPTWSKEATGQPLRVFRGIHRNWMSWPDQKVEILSASEDSVTARFSRPYAAAFGEKGILYGCTIDEFERVMELAHQGIAEHLGLEYEQRRDGDSLHITLRRRPAGGP